MQLDSVETSFCAGKPWRTLLSLYWPEKRWVFLALFSYLFKASPVWILPVITANIIDIIGHHRAGATRLLWINATVGAVAIAQNIPATAFYVAYLSHGVRNVEVRLRSSLVRRLQMLSIGFHSRADTGTLQTKVLRDVESVQMMSWQVVDVGFFAVMTIIVALGVTTWRMPVFVPVFLLFVPLIWLVRRLMAGKMRRYNESLRKEMEGMNSLVLGMIQMIPITRAHAVENEELTRLESKFQNVRTAARSFDFVSGTFGATAWVILMLFNLAGLTVAAFLSYNGILHLTVGDIVLLAGYFGTIMTSVMQLNSMMPLITRGFDALRSIGEVIECPDIEENRGKRAVATVRGEFEFENVSFSYGQNNPALKRISLRIGEGEVIGITGPSGSGKSTFVSLVTGFHRPTGGRILLDGLDMNQIDLRTFRRHLAIVSQQTILFNGTLRENIIYGSKNVDEAELQAAIESAGASDFISDLPSGLETELGANGVRLSGGQRQRMAIARALLRDPRVLILDEATSALDSASEALVQQALERLMVGRTAFIIAHRHHLLRCAGRILVLNSGECTVVRSKEFFDRNAVV
jgi:ATP-binding cassette subfamily B protein